jgi:hypothetical protein
MNSDKVKDGVADAMSFWLNQHDITMSDILLEAIGKAVKNWLDDHEDEILEMIGEKFNRETGEVLNRK